MSDEIEELAKRLVVGHKRDGRAVYDEQAKAELVGICRRPGAKVSSLAKRCAVNANQVRRWIREEQAGRSRKAGPLRGEPSAAAFVPMQLEAAVAQAVVLQVKARLPNGVVVDIEGCDAARVDLLIESLGRLRCSVWTKG